MTIIAAVEHDKGVTIAYDTLVVDEVGKYRMNPMQRKVTPNGDWLVGAAGRLRVSQIVQAMKMPPPPPNGVDMSTYMARVVAKALQEEFEDSGLDLTDSGQKFISHSELLLAVNGTAWTVSEDYAMSRATDPIGPYNGVLALGSGAAVGLGAYYAHASGKTRANPRQIVRAMVQAAILFDPYCGGEIHFYEQEKA